MIGFKNKTELLKTLFNDYSEHSGSVEDCFVYRYLKSRKDMTALEISVSKNELYAYKDKPRHEKYILLHAAYLAWKNGVIDRREYSDFFSELAQKERGGRIFSDMLDNDPDRAQHEFEVRLIKGSVEDYFSNQGFRACSVSLGYDSSETAESLLTLDPGKSRKKHGGYIDDIEMAYKFERLNKSEPGASPQTDVMERGFSEEYILKCNAVFNAAKASGSGEVVIPLYFEPSTGAGIYIIGSSYIKNDSSGCCAVYALWFSFLDAADEFDNELPMYVMCKAYSSVFEAFESFPDGMDDYYINYADCNGSVPPNSEYDIFDRLIGSDREYGRLSRDQRIINAEKSIEDSGIAVQRQAKKTQGKA